MVRLSVCNTDLTRMQPILGKVAALVPVGAYALGGAVDSAVSTVVSCVAYNVESAIVGRDEAYCFEEIFYTTVNSAIVGAGSSLLFDGTFIENTFSKVKIPKTDKSVADIIESISIFNAVVDAMKLPQTHTWKSPNVGRWYVFE